MSSPSDVGVRRPPAWLDDAVIYEIYPQSFADANGDGIGDLAGVLEHLDHLSWLGINTIWFNPCFASPFRDAGYDVADYEQIAPRYGSNVDMVALVEAARERGIRVLLDLVAGHTSIAHPWFQSALRDPADDRYVWSAEAGEAFVPSPGPRSGYYLKNFFEEQPALNFGYSRLDVAEPWRQPVNAPGPQANRAALREVMAFWLDRGIAGFRVDMAYSLVKDDPGLVATAALWRELSDWVYDAYPEAVLLPESHYPAPPDIGQRSGFSADFFLVIHPAHSALFNNGGAGTLPWLPDHHSCFFEADGRDGPGSLRRFLDVWDEHQDANGPDRRVVLGTADHDFSRLCCGDRIAEQLPAAYVFLLTWGTIPSIYYGDEIGMRYLPGLPDHEGSVCNPAYNRAGCRTPMQWDASLPDAGFSTAAPSALYLPQDPDPDRPTVAAQRADPGSVLHTVRRLLALRAATPALGTVAGRRVLHADYPLVYLRDDTHLVVVNPRRQPATVTLPDLDGRTARPLEADGADIERGEVTARGFGWSVFELVDGGSA